jgi:choline dehydrogenase
VATRGWDYVVVGAGAAGCVVAGRLAQTIPDVRIALIEAGGVRLGLTTKIPGTAFIASTSPRRSRRQRLTRPPPEPWMIAA